MEQNTKTDVLKKGKDVNEVINIKLDNLVPFKNHPFKLYEGQRLKDMVDSVSNYGIIVPLVIRKKDKSYEILSGHNRVKSAKIIGLSEVPAIIKDNLTDEEATLIVTETNLMQRSFTDLSHSERAAVIYTRHNAMKGQGVRNDLINEIEKLSKAPNLAIDQTCCPLGNKLKTIDKIGDEYGLSARTVARYLRINKLTVPLKEMVNQGKISMRAGVDLSYLSEDNQEMVEAIVSENTFKVVMKKASILRAYGKKDKLTWHKAVEIITGKYNNQVKNRTGIRIQSNIISKYFNPEQNEKDIENIIDRALQLYFNRINEIEVIEEEDEELTL
ncbi:hypothetical protein SH1V18_38830 [Vallitalea longa]|uniref:ParB-like N-terminal domain-containing protein n=1 Tax=Vallitalea longa TaxID=2936439 RepID=A0A9W5YFK4_9FIRM|nr:ParB N-terminal domain-containing protein [Vallitalea longa]GKX31403.1 hypothetical protein SH1V18_38830 [Vallitalea longa]